MKCSLKILSLITIASIVIVLSSCSGKEKESMHEYVSARHIHDGRLQYTLQLPCGEDCSYELRVDTNKNVLYASVSDISQQSYRSWLAHKNTILAEEKALANVDPIFTEFDGIIQKVSKDRKSEFAAGMIRSADHTVWVVDYHNDLTSHYDYDINLQHDLGGSDVLRQYFKHIDTIYVSGREISVVFSDNYKNLDQYAQKAYASMQSQLPEYVTLEKDSDPSDLFNQWILNKYQNISFLTATHTLHIGDTLCKVDQQWSFRKNARDLHRDKITIPDMVLADYTDTIISFFANQKNFSIQGKDYTIGIKNNLITSMQLNGQPICIVNSLYEGIPSDCSCSCTVVYNTADGQIYDKEHRRKIDVRKYPKLHNVIEKYGFVLDWVHKHRGEYHLEV